MEVVPYRELHYHSYLAGLIPRPLGILRGLHRTIKPDDPVFTWFKGEHVMGIGGVTKLWEGVGEAWILLDAEASRYPIMTRKLAAYYLAESRKDFWRIQATIKADFREGVRFALSLGFSLNTENRPMRRYGVDGQDYHMLEMMGCKP